MSVTVELMNVSGEPVVPTQADFQHWSNAALTAMGQTELAFELGIRLIDENESAELNQNFRHKQGPTNVLSFTYEDIPQAVGQALLGDLAICTQVVMREALEQKKSAQAHWAHMTVHGMLHLLGQDHKQEKAASAMESLESVILAKLGYANPYS